jgi:hypothetical protein
VTDAIALQYALRKVNNLWIGYISGPVLALAVLFALSCWHTDPRSRRLIRLAGLGLIALVGLLTLLVEDLSRHSLIRRPAESLLIVVVSLWTLLTLVRQETGHLGRQDWFWICLGLTLRYGAAIAIDPLARSLLGPSQEAVYTAYQIRSVAFIVSYVVIARGMWCRILPLGFSGRTSPQLSASS